MATHSLIDAGIELKKDGVAPEAVESMVARVHPTVIEKVNRRHPASGLEGRFSLHHCIAVGLTDGAALPEQFSDHKVNDPAIGSLRERITAQEDAGFSEEEALLQATLVDGRTLTERVVHPTGDPENPVTDAQLEGKFRALVGSILPKDRMERLLDRLWNVDSVADITEVLELAKPQD